MRRLVSFLSATIALSACQPAAPKVDVAAEEAAIRGQVAAFDAALRARNDSAIAALFAPDAVLMPPNMERDTGSVAIRASFAGLAQLNATLSLTPAAISVAGAGDMAIEEGTWTYSMPLPDSSTYKDNGKYLVYWKKHDGTWLIQADIWNSDNAPPSPSGN